MSNQPYQFKSYGDWLIWRATGPLGEFRMPVCSQIIQNEGMKDNWLYLIQPRDIEKILARYKEHVSYWNIRMEVIQAELNAFSQALDSHHNYFEIATLFDAAPANRLPSD